MSTILPSNRPALRLVPSATPEVEWTWFCGHCAAPAPGGSAPAPSSRVCPSCHFGLLLETRSDVIPTSKDAFLVIDSSLLVQAVSRTAESLLEISEADAVNRPLHELITPADAEAQGPTGFAALIAEAMATDDAVSAYVRPGNTFGVRMRAKIAPCGPPRAALIVLETARRPTLRAV